jgi:hypothetical protein
MISLLGLSKGPLRMNFPVHCPFALRNLIEKGEVILF